MQLSDYVNDVRNLIHDPNASDFANPTLIGFINDGRRRVALDCSVGQNTFITGLNTITQQEVYPLTGFVGGVTMTANGSGGTAGTYNLGFSGGGGSNAAGSYTIGSSGAITATSMTNWGSGYTSAPIVSFPSGSITGATGTAITVTGALNWKLVSVLWGNLRITFDYLPFPAFQAYARAYAFLFSRPGCFAVHKNNQQVYTYPISDQPYPMEIEIVQYPAPLVNLTDTDTQIIDPWDDAVKFYAAGAAMASLQNYDQADYWWGDDPRKPGKYQLRVRQLPAGVTPYRVFNPYRIGRLRMRRL